MSGYKSFAVLGAGNIGGPIISALLAAKSAGTVSRVVVLSRSDSKSSVPDGAEVARVDYESHSSLTKALVGVDVVISTIAFSAFPVQHSVARAAKDAGSKLFVPSEFGTGADQEINTAEVRGFFEAKRKAEKEIREFLPTASFYNGNFGDWMWLPDFGTDLASGRVTVGGDGNAKMAFTARDDIAQFVVHVLTSLAPAQLENRIFRIQGDYMSFNEVFRVYEQKHNVKLDVTYVPIEELKKKVGENPYDIASILHLVFALGYCTVGKPLDNDLWADWKPKKLAELL